MAESNVFARESFFFNYLAYAIGKLFNNSGIGLMMIGFCRNIGMSYAFFKGEEDYDL